MGFNVLLHFIIILAVPPFFIGVINRVKSIFAGRKGPPLLQPYFDIVKLLRKGAVYSKSASFLFRIAPLIILVSTISAGLIVPIAGTAPVHFYGDIILFVYFLALARFVIIISAFDVGSSFEGMGASREAIFGAFSELTIFTGLAVLSVVFHSLSMTEIFRGDFLKEPALLFLFATLFFILLTENSRMPIDDPNTHLELTMVHEVMVLDYGGPDLGIILYASSIKLFLFMVFTALVLFPNGSLNFLPAACLLLVKILGVSILIGIVESTTVRIRLIKIPQFLIVSFVMTIFALLVSLFERGRL